MDLYRSGPGGPGVTTGSNAAWWSKVTDLVFYAKSTSTVMSGRTAGWNCPTW